jgi:hypothetical protein
MSVEIWIGGVCSVTAWRHDTIEVVSAFCWIIGRDLIVVDPPPECVHLKVSVS